MINIIRADGKTEVEFLAKLEERNRSTNNDVTAVVTEIIDNVRQNGDKAVREYTIKFDGKAPECFEVSKDEIDSSIAQCDPKFF